MAELYIKIREVAEQFGRKVRTMREYRRLEIIDPVKRVKGADKYVPAEVKRAAKIVAENSFKTLNEVAKIVREDREKYRKSVKARQKR